jgi:hypothetical protein
MLTTRHAPGCFLFGRVLGLGLLVLFAVGCAGRGDVSGTVTFNGKPLVFGTVTFEGSDGSLQYGNIKPDGSYTVNGVALGEAKVAVSSTNPKSSDFQPLQREGGPKPKARPEIKGWFRIPEIYDTPYKSGLTYKINSGANTIDIKLK